MEWYPYLSLGAVTGRDISWRLIRGVGPLGGLNWGAHTKVLKITPGFRFQLDLPGFSFANLDYLYLVDRSQGLAAGGAPKENNSHMIDLNWQLPFEIGGGSFSFEGHGEWHSPRDNELGSRVSYWILASAAIALRHRQDTRPASGTLLRGNRISSLGQQIRFRGSRRNTPPTPAGVPLLTVPMAFTAWPVESFRYTRERKHWRHPRRHLRAVASPLPSNPSSPWSSSAAASFLSAAPPTVGRWHRRARAGRSNLLPD